MERFATWVNDVIGCFRVEVAKLSEQERAAISNLDDLSEPRQVEATWIRHPQMDLNVQVLIFSKFPDIPDMTVSVHGPVGPWDAIDHLEAIRNKPQWAERKPAGALWPNWPYSRILEVPFMWALDNLRAAAVNTLMRPGKDVAVPRSARRLSDEAFCWLFHGDATQQPPEAVVGGLIQAAMRTAKAPAPQRERPLTEEGFGTFFYPPLWVGQIPSESTQDRFQRAMQGAPAFTSWFRVEEAVRASYKGAPTIVEQDGFIAIREADPEKALRMLNEITAVAVLCGLNAMAIREHELCELEFSGHQILGRTAPISSMRMAWGTQAMAGFETTPETIPLGRRIVAPADLERILHTAERVTTADIPALPLFLEAHTALEDSEYPQSYIMSWAVIEDWIADKWARFLKADRRLSGRRLKKLTESHLAWTVDHYLEALNLAGELSDERYDSLMALKSKRNNMLHQRRMPTEGDARLALNAATALLRELLPFAIEPFLAAKAKS